MSDTIIFYGTPAHGHINPTLPIITGLVDKSYKVIYYATEEYRDVITDAGADFKAYDFGGIEWNPEVGNRIFKLAELVLKFTDKQLKSMADAAELLNPVLIMHDTIALWGKCVAEKLQIKAVSVNAIVTIYPYTKKTFKLYTEKFLWSSVKDIYTLFNIFRYKRRLKQKSIISILMNEEELNIFTYPKEMHPDGNKMGKDCFFLGSSAVLRKSCQNDEIKYNDEIQHNDIIYVSLGTIFNKSDVFYKRIMEEFANSKYTVIISCGSNCEKYTGMDISSNIHLMKYVNQKQIMKNAKLFITAGGMNSLCEAMANQVPCLMYPQQGEQCINCKSIEKLKGGKMLNLHKGILQQSEMLINEYSDRVPVDIFSKVYMKELLEHIEEYMKTDGDVD